MKKQKQPPIEVMRAARKAKGLSQRALGIALGFSEESAERRVQHMEYGTRPIPIEKVRLLAKTLGVRLGDLIP